MKEVIAALLALRPKFGAVGTRDVDVRAQQARIDATIAALTYLSDTLPPTFVAKHVALKQKGAKLLMTLELDAVEGAPVYLVTPINPAAVRSSVFTAGDGSPADQEARDLKIGPYDPEFQADTAKSVEHEVAATLERAGETAEDAARMAREAVAPALTEQQIYDRFSFLEGLVSQSTYVKIAETAIEIHGAAAVPSEAAITACALMIKGICMTSPREEWLSKIEARIRFMLKQIASQGERNAQ